MAQPTIEDVAKSRPDKRYIVQFTMISGIKYFHSTNINRNYDTLWDKGMPGGFVLPGTPRLILQVDEIESVIIMENTDVNTDGSEAKVSEETGGESQQSEVPGKAGAEKKP